MEFTANAAERGEDILLSPLLTQSALHSENPILDGADLACQVLCKNWRAMPPLLRDWAMSSTALETSPTFKEVAPGGTALSPDELTEGFWKDRAYAINEFESAISYLNFVFRHQGQVFSMAVDVLAKYGLRWTKVPLRYTAGELNMAYTHWIESSDDALGTSLFSSVGIWTSPSWATEVFIHSCFALLVGSCAIIASYLSRSVWPDTIDNVIQSLVREPISMAALGVAFVLSGINDALMWVSLSKLHSVELAKSLMVLQACITLGAGLLFMVASACDGCFGHGFFENKGPWCTLFYLTNGTARGGGAFMLARKPHLSFYIHWLKTSLECMSWTFFVLGSVAAPFWIGVLIFANCWAFISGAINLRRRNAAVKEAFQLEQAASDVYNRVWAKLRCEESFDSNAQDLKRTWKAVMDNPSKKTVPKLQGSSSIEELFQAADALNPLFQQKAKELASAVNGLHIEANVKAETRALEKVFRVCSGNYRKLADLVRTSIVFSGKGAVMSMKNCLLKLADDPEWELIFVDNGKFRVDIETAVASGYRDVQLCVRLRTPAAIENGLQTHLCEMQLHLYDIHTLKSENGHKNYIACRNLRGR